MACILDRKTSPSGKILEWVPEQIPSTKPFIHIVTSPSEPLTTQDNMNFVKTKTLIYSAFHQTARYINFEVGYPTDAKWFEFLSDKWNDFSNFFVGGFFEAVYTTTEKSSSTTATYIQVDAKSIDYDTRF